MITNIFKNFNIFELLIIVQIGSICVKNTQNMGMAKLVQNNLKKIFEYFGQIYSFAKIFVDFYLG